MNVLIVGSGAREHTLAWRVNQSPRLNRLWVANGNAGTASIATNLDVAPGDVTGIVDAAQSLKIDLVVVGPELPLSLGLVDQLNKVGISAFGPTQQAARLETSKSFALDVMREAGVACPEFWVFREEKDALDFLSNHGGPTVVKADGLAAGKGVTLCDNATEAAAAVRQCMSQNAFGAAGQTVVIEERLTGPEVSVFAFSDGQHVSALTAACDYKRLEVGDRGPNTGGMGSFGPPGFWDSVLSDEVERSVIKPVIETMARRGTPYQGVLYAGIMLTETGPKVLEFNCRFGDPETQVVMPRLVSDPLDVMEAACRGGLDRVPVDWDTQSYVGVVMASGGYPGEYDTGFAIEGLDAPNDGTDEGTLIFHAATRLEAGPDSQRLVTSGGRVLTVVGCGGSLAKARAKAYDRIRRIRFQGAIYREDIGAQEDIRAIENRVESWLPGPAASTG